MRALTQESVREIAKDKFGIIVNDAICRTVVSTIMCKYQDYIRRLQNGAINCEKHFVPDKLIMKYISSAIKSIDLNYWYEDKKFTAFK